MKTRRYRFASKVELLAKNDRDAQKKCSKKMFLTFAERPEGPQELTKLRGASCEAPLRVGEKNMLGPKKHRF